MRQKYFISRESIKNKLNIKEYAVILRVLNHATTSTPGKEAFSFLGEETYDGSTIEGSIHSGIEALVSTLRTRNLFPIGPHAMKIAESVMKLYESDENRSAELFFDDVDLFEEKIDCGEQTKQKARKIISNDLQI